MFLGGRSDNTGNTGNSTCTQTYTDKHVSVSHTNNPPSDLYSFLRVKNHVNTNVFQWSNVCNVTVGLTHSIQYIVLDRKKRRGNTIAETQGHNWFVSPITQTKISIHFCNNSKNPCTLSKSISSHAQPLARVPHPSPSITQSQHHTSLSSLYHGTSLFSFPAPFKTMSPVSTFPTDCALTLQKSKGILSVLIIHVWWEARASLLCKPRKKCFYRKCAVCVCVFINVVIFLLLCVFFRIIQMFTTWV